MNAYFNLHDVLRCRSWLVIQAVGCFLGAPGLHASPEPLPPIFLPAAKAPAPPVTRETAASPISDRVHRLITQQVLAKAETFSAPTSSVSLQTDSPAVGGDAVTMDKVFVRSSSLQLRESPEPLSRLQRFSKHGIFYRSFVGNVEMVGFASLYRFYSNRQGSGGTETRAEIRFEFRW